MSRATADEWGIASRRIEVLERALQQHEREAAINEEQASAVYRYLLELSQAIPGAVIGMSASGTILRCNAEAYQLLGHVEPSLIGRSIECVWPQALAKLKRFQQGEMAVIREEAEWLATDGQTITVLLSASATRDEDANLLSMACVAIDLRQYKRLELELRHAHKLDSLGQLAAGIAHEINSPMQFISDHLYFVRETLNELPEPLATSDDVSRCRQALDAVLEGVGRVNHIVDAMRVFSHPHTHMTAVDINKNLQDTLVVARHAYRYVADVETDLGPLPSVTGNGGDLNQVFLNLIVNAAQAIAENHAADQRGRIGIRSRQFGDTVQIEVSDDGPGIPDAIRERVFDPFFTTKEVGKGTGQGLAIARTLVVDRHHGTLTFESGPQGTTFRVCLPVTAA